MVREIVKDTEALSQKCEKVLDVKQVKEIIQDLIDTINDNNENNTRQCCGLAANQIGENVKVIVVQMPNGKLEPFINPVIVSHSKTRLMSTEGCMSLEGERVVERYEKVMIMAQNMSGKWYKKAFGGFTAIAIQHEIDHTNGILI